MPKATLLLLENGADTSIRDGNGLTAVEYVQKSSNNAMLEVFKPSCEIGLSILIFLPLPQRISSLLSEGNNFE